MHPGLMAEIQMQQQSDLNLMALKQRARDSLEIVLKLADQRGLLAVCIVLEHSAISAQALMSNKLTAEVDA
jgi:hypothetical protein